MICITGLRWIEETLRRYRAAHLSVYDARAYPLELWSGPALAMFI